MKQHPIDIVVIAALVAMLLMALHESNNLRKECGLYKTKLSHDFEQKYLKLEQQLKQSDSIRSVVTRRLDSANRVSQDVSILNRKLKADLAKIRGTYNNKTNTELEQLMEDRVK